MTRDTRDRLLAAAERIVAREGAARLTLDAVAQEGDVSKGGLLYHFPSKEALLTAMIGRQCEGWRSHFEARLAGGSRSAPALIGAAMEAHCATHEGKSREVGAGLMAAAAANPELLAEARKLRDPLWSEIEAGARDKGLALLLLVAIDGLAFADLLGISNIDESRLRLLTERIKELAAIC